MSAPTREACPRARRLSACGENRLALLAAALGPLVALGWCWQTEAGLRLPLALAFLSLPSLRALTLARHRPTLGLQTADPSSAVAPSQREEACHPVTGLPTRERLIAAVQAHDTAGGASRLLAAVRFVDFDRIAGFDQALAHRALGSLADRINRAVRRNHVIVQVDRDTFAIWFAGQDDVDAARAELRTLTHLLLQELPGPTTTISPAIEVGTAIYPDDSRSAAPLLTRAFAGRHHPAQAADGSLRLADPEPFAVRREAFVLEQDLAQAIAEEQLSMLFQPLVDLTRRRVVGAEALLRWQHPTLGAVSPARFIPIVEDIGLSDHFGAWVLNTACREMRRWRDAGLRDLRVAVNLSACQLADPKLQEKIERTLARHHLPPEVLELELTETAAMADAGRTLRLFHDLRALGIALALDDFGSGHSSLTYLKNLPFDKLKIDREFVTEVHRRDNSQAICRALVELGRGLHLRVLAEGVETREEVEMLTGLGCSLFQGYFFSRPLPGSAFLAFAGDPRRLPDPEPASRVRLHRIEGLPSA